MLEEVTINGLGYNGSIPGPLLLFRQGENIQIELENRLDKKTALHVHGLSKHFKTFQNISKHFKTFQNISKPVSQDGVPETEPETPFIRPGQSYTYQFNAWQTGTFFYHASDASQIPQGLMGLLLFYQMMFHMNKFHI
ncbi:multicopper oxidase domain-containing protein [Niallia sp. JL1B1071]|uniref:multicopper oxidase domain-containing protein n=1 Tax=Niallia tiangongensis TaxID=3237105 RepID=UPI0037DC05D4